MSNTLSLGPSSSNYESSGATGTLKKPILTDNSEKVWQILSKYGQGPSNNGRLVTENLNIINGHTGGVNFVNSSFRGLDFNYGSARKVTTTNSTFEKSEGPNGRHTNFSGSTGDDTLIFGAQTTLKDVKVDLKECNDYLKFKATSNSECGDFNLGSGADTVTFMANSKVGTGNTVDLGNDSDVDKVVIENNAKVSGIQINNFKSQDVLIVGGQTKTYGQLVDGDNNIGGLTIKIDKV